MMYTSDREEPPRRQANPASARISAHYVLRSAQFTTTTAVPIMYCCYEESVIAAADEHGNLTSGDASKLLAEHGFSLDDIYEDNHGVSWAHLDARNAEALLAWLGY